MYLLRLDDASEYMDTNKWTRMEKLLDKYGVKPIFGIIPHNEDPQLITYEKNPAFWDWVRQKIADGWTPAMHGYNHCFETKEGGINPVNRYSEFAGVSYERQCEKIKNGYKILIEHEINPEIFFAPAHTFDENTLKALETETPIRVISDTIANDVYYKEPFYFIPQQSGSARSLSFKLVTFCYHPNTMNENGFKSLGIFLESHASEFIDYSEMILKQRKKSIIDRFCSFLYFIRR